MPEKQSFIIRNKGIRGAAVVAVQEVQAEPVMVVTIEPYTERRNLDQNKLFHVLMRELSKKYFNHYGKAIAPDVWKEYLKRKFLGQESVLLKNGDSFAYTRHTADLNKKDMAGFIDQCVMWSADELDLDIMQE